MLFLVIHQSFALWILEKADAVFMVGNGEAALEEALRVFRIGARQRRSVDESECQDSVTRRVLSMRVWSAVHVKSQPHIRAARIQRKLSGNVFRQP